MAFGSLTHLVTNSLSQCQAPALSQACPGDPGVNKRWLLPWRSPQPGRAGGHACGRCGQQWAWLAHMSQALLRPSSSDWERCPGVICEEGARVGSVAGCRIPGWALALVFLTVSVRRCQALVVAGLGCAEGLAAVVRGWPQGRCLQRGCGTCSDSRGGSGTAGGLGKLHPAPLGLCAAWHSDGGGELVQPHGCMLGTMGCQRDGGVRDHQRWQRREPLCARYTWRPPHAVLGQGGATGNGPPRAHTGTRTLFQVLLCNPLPLPYPTPSFNGSQPFLDKGSSVGTILV